LAGSGRAGEKGREAVPTGSGPWDQGTSTGKGIRLGGLGPWAKGAIGVPGDRESETVGETTPGAAVSGIAGEEYPPWGWWVSKGTAWNK
jgi:hypothetical protein